jgi:hypothetical protein
MSVYLIKFSRAFRTEISPGTSDEYIDATADLNAQVLADACEHCKKNCMFMPSIAEIRKAYAGIISEARFSPNQTLQRDPAISCPDCHGNWYVMFPFTKNERQYEEARPCPRIEQHRTDWAKTHPDWIPNAPKVSVVQKAGEAARRKGMPTTITPEDLK